MKTLSITFAFLLCGAATAHAEATYPMLMSLQPVAAQVGETSELTVHSRYTMYGAYQVLVTGQGVTGEIVPHPDKPKDGKIPNLTQQKIKFTVAADALPGVREIRVATPRGVSTIGQLVVTRDPVIREAKKNNTPDEAQAITLPATVCGTIEKSEDVDYFKFQVDAGAELCFHVRSMRLQDKIHDLQQHVDPIITLYRAGGGTLAVADNIFFGDPLLAYRFEEAGEYLLEIRDLRYQGNKYWSYSIEINDRPYASTVHPLGVARGTAIELELVGWSLGDHSHGTLTIPQDALLGAGNFEIPVAGTVTNPVSVIVDDQPQVVESDEENNAADTAQMISLPAGISGRISDESDIDCFAFEAKKGDRFSFEVVARRYQSGLDSHLRILNSQGKQFALNDDLSLGKRRYSDSWIENWKAPADGKYVIEIRDLHLRGGPEFVYYVRATRSVPYFELFADTDKTQMTPGTNGVVFVRAKRKNGFKGPIQLNVANLPQGVTAHCGQILAGGTDGCIIFESAADAPLNVANVKINGTTQIEEKQGEPKSLTANATVYQETYRPGGGRGHWEVETHTVSVGAPHDIRKVTLNTTDLKLKPGQSQKVEVTLQRAPGFTGNVTLDALFRHLGGIYGNSLPPGVTLDMGASKTLLTGSTSKGVLVFKAAANAKPVEKQQVAVMANVSINFVMKSTYCGPPLMVTVQKP